MFSFKRAIPEEIGIPSGSIKNLLIFLDKKEIPMHSLLIMRKDKLIFEKYYAPYKAFTLHRMFSISKSLTAIAISLLIDEGKIAIDAPITDYFPEYVNSATHPWVKETTIRNMLMMRTCHASTTYKVDMKSDWVKSFFDVTPTHKPGTVFHYDTSSAHVLCALVEKLTGMPMLDYLKDKVLNHLDFSKDSYMVKDPFGVSIGGSGLMATPMDVLKILYLLDKKGTVTCSDGVTRTLLNPDFVKDATSNLSDTIMTAPIPSEACGYGYMIWTNEKGGYVMYGMGGQLAISIPDKELLIVTTADTQGIGGGNQVIYDGIYNILLPAITEHIPKEISEAEKESNKELLNMAATLKITMPRIPGVRIPENIKKLSNTGDSISLHYNLNTNNSGFKIMKLHLTDEGCSMITFDNQEIFFGLKDMQEGRLPNPGEKNGTHYTAGAIWLRENVLFIKVNLIGESVGSIRFELYFGDEDVTVFMRKIEETYFNEFNGHLYGELIR